MAKQYRSKVLASVHETALDMPWKGTDPQRVQIPPGRLSFQPVAIGADDGGNDVV